MALSLLPAKRKGATNRASECLQDLQLVIELSLNPLSDLWQVLHAVGLEVRRVAMRLQCRIVFVLLVKEEASMVVAVPL